jgi:hypothetical protein
MWKIRIYTFLTVIAFGFLYLFTGMVVIALIPLALLRLKRAVRLVMQVWAKSAFLIIGKNLHIEGKENIKKTGKYILVANHSSLFDIMAIISFFPGVSWFGHERSFKDSVIPGGPENDRLCSYEKGKYCQYQRNDRPADRKIGRSYNCYISGRYKDRRW